MDKKVEEIISKYQYSRDIKKYSNRYFFRDNSIYSRINSNRDVEIAKNRVESNLQMLSKVFPLERVDIEELEKDMGRYELAVKKVLWCFDNRNTDFNYTAEELQGLIDSIFSFYDKINNVSIRKLNQD
ncbi:hypothetical protein AM501_26765 [Aneurinibacillus migulanus]|uniref:hypothetical protein n=1 Tax=Aneurinibacillus migulanus TaxID=47500 RepID=UPI0005BDB236|nr:hypothetical protein [Aneurinibacillus migulanus]KIV55035.1 hypothetical protein TS64_12200 [Aneurinibacillus migulanus]KPD05319.1 hypothetical protein AM501_26765 [Aneurinibacillus migulanus]